MVFDKLENGIKETPYKQFMEGVYGGKKLYTTICQNCGEVSTRSELFYNLSLKVKNVKDIFDSLEDHNTEETISDFLCEKCNQKVEISRRCSLDRLPNVLIIHLQRLIFDLETLQNIKINSRFEFP